ncbi:bifunctional proline dehydrogenase/L-glutamate gamma-semialdehyde dehydrogenase [Candidatus Woesearchaeota archaeon]|nr:bifunctional proline dehydrogenase/L-glutamate gamma-semialdehyde dehydrogenase [Candidatus Woesearchaeota archaeon]
MVAKVIQTTQKREQRIQELGKQILTEAQQHIPALHTEGGRRNALFDLCMQDQQAATQIFRFMDVFPSLKNDAIVPHLKEYLIDTHVNLGVLSPLVKATNIAPMVAIKTIKHFSENMAKSFIAGNTIEEGVDAVASFPVGRSCTFDIVGEITTSKVDAEKYLHAYLHALDVLEKVYGKNAVDAFGKPKINLSVKLSALYEHFDPVDPEGTSEHVRKRLRPIFRKARSISAFINLDMEHFQYNRLTNKIFMELLEEDEFKDFAHAGCVVQAYLTSSSDILDMLIAFAKKRGIPITVRLVKGAYWDHEVMLACQNGWEIPVYTKKKDTDANYEHLAEKLAQNNHYVRGAFATHNARSVAVVLALVEEYNLDKKYWEIQKLYGVAQEIGTSLEKMNVPVRDYVPCGALVPAMGYFVRRLLENSSNEAFVRGLKKDLDINALLKNPADTSIASSPQHTAQTTSSSLSSSSSNNGFLSKIKSYFSSEVSSHVNNVNNNHVNTTKKSEQTSSFKNYPAPNFADPAFYQEYTTALSKFNRKKGIISHRLKIGKHWVDTGAFLPSYNPSYKTEVLGKVTKGSRKEIELALQAAAEAFQTWKKLSAEERANYLFKTADIMSEKLHELSILIMYESGKTAREAYADVVEAIDFLNYYGDQMIALDKEVFTQSIPGEDNTAFWQPCGVAAVISPWNFPLAILTGMVSAALVAGNTVVMKPASATPLIAGELMRLFEQAGLPGGVLNFVVCDSKDAEVLITSPLVHLIAFTGSEDVGKFIYEKASLVNKDQKQFKNVIIETGGKNAIIVDESADLEQAVVGVLKSAFGYSGQKCSAASRVIVFEAVYDIFVEKLKNAILSLRLADSCLPEADLGPVINEAAFSRILSLIKQAEQQGGKILAGGKADNSKGYFIQPTLIAIEPNNIIAQEEIFGPVLAVLKAKNFNQALELANNTRYALTGGLYSRTPSHILRAKHEFEVGNLYVNRTITGAVVGRQYFGGFKLSGLGSKAGGPEYLPRFMHRVVRTINQDRSGHIPNILEYVK